MEKETIKKIQELQTIEQQLQVLLLEKQSFQVEFNEVANAIGEIKKSKENVYKILGNIMLKAEPSALAKELEERKRLLNIRLSSVERQEKIFQEKADKSREDIGKTIASEK